MKIEALLGFAQNAGALASGHDAVLRALKGRRVALLLLACDAAGRLVRKMREEAGRRDVPVFVWGTKAALGRSLGKRDLGVVAVCDKGFAGALERELRGGGLEKG